MELHRLVRTAFAPSPKGKAFLVALPVALFLVACASVGTVDRANGFATAGIAYADGVPAVIDESFKAAVTADSLVLADARDSLETQEARLQRLEAADRDFEQRLAILRDIKRHVELLRAYFSALRSLAQSDAASGITDVTEGLVKKLGEVSRKVKNAKIGDAPISDLIAPAVKISVGAYQNAAIQSELRAHGATIERELALQQAVLTALTDQMISNSQVVLTITERNPIVIAFAGMNPLPANWSEQRVTAYNRTIEIDSLKVAQKAATDLHQAWVAFSENRLDENSLLLLVSNVEELVDLARSFKTKTN